MKTHPLRQFIRESLEAEPSMTDAEILALPEKDMKAINTGADESTAFPLTLELPSGAKITFPTRLSWNVTRMGPIRKGLDRAAAERSKAKKEKVSKAEAEEAARLGVSPAELKARAADRKANYKAMGRRMGWF